MNNEEYQSGFVKPEEESELEFVRRTSDPTRAKHSKKPSRVKMTVDTLASLLFNRSSGNLNKAFEKYNHDYNELRRIALEVNESKKDDKAKSEAGKGEFTDVKEKLEEYNAQVKRLAESAVKILLFDDEIQKIKFKVAKDVEKSSARALKVPPFLIGPLKYLSSTGRLYMKNVKEEKERAQEALEQEIADVVAKTAREVVGLNPNGDNIEEAAQKTMDKKESAILGTLADASALRDVVVSELNAPTPDVPSVSNTVAPEAPAVDPAKGQNEQNEKNSQVDAGISKKIEKAQAETVLPIQDQAMDMLQECIDTINTFGVETLQNSDKSKERLTLYVVSNNEKQYLNPEMLAEILGCASLSDEEKKDIYDKKINDVLFAKLWQEKVSFAEVNNDVFEFIYDAVKKGYGEDTLLVKASRELSPEKQQILKSFITGNFALVRKTIESFASKFENEKENVGENEEMKNAQVDAGIQRRIAKVKAAEEVAQNGNNGNASHEQENTSSTEPAKQNEDPVTPPSIGTAEPEKEEEKANKTPIDEINDKIGEFIDKKAELQKIELSEDKIRKMSEIDAKLNTLIRELNELVKTGKAAEHSNEKPAVSEETEPKKEVETPKSTPDVVASSKEAEEPKIIPDDVADSKEVDDSDEYAKYWGELYGKILDDPDSEKTLSSLKKNGVDFEEVQEKYRISNQRISVRNTGPNLAEMHKREIVEENDPEINKAKNYVAGELLSSASLDVISKEMIDEWDQYDEQKVDLVKLLSKTRESEKDKYDAAVEEVASAFSKVLKDQDIDADVDFKQAITSLFDGNDVREKRRNAISILKIDKLIGKMQVAEAEKYVVRELLSSIDDDSRKMLDGVEQHDGQKVDLIQGLKAVRESKEDKYGAAVEKLASTLSESGVKDVDGNEVDFKKVITSLLDSDDWKEKRGSAVSILKAVSIDDKQKTM